MPPRAEYKNSFFFDTAVSDTANGQALPNALLDESTNPAIKNNADLIKFATLLSFKFLFIFSFFAVIVFIFTLPNSFSNSLYRSAYEKNVKTKKGTSVLFFKTLF